MDLVWVLVAMVWPPLGAGGPGPSDHELAARAAGGLGDHWGSVRERHHVLHVGQQADVADEVRWALGHQAGDGQGQRAGCGHHCYSWLKPRVLFLSHCK